MSVDGGRIRIRKNKKGPIVPGPSGLIGIDIDGESGRQSLLELEKELGSLPQTWTVTSGRENGGTHYYFRSPEFEVSNRVSWREGIDFRHRVKIPPATPTQIERCRKHVARCPAAINNQGGHNQTFAVAKVIFYDFGLTEEEGWKIFQEYNQRCDPLWSDRELHHKMDDAKHATNKPIGWHDS